MYVGPSPVYSHFVLDASLALEKLNLSFPLSAFHLITQQPNIFLILSASLSLHSRCLDFLNFHNL